jgi:predicted membrane-bound mannosyltransferase
MASVTWLIVAFLIFWLVSLAALAALFLWLMQRQEKRLSEQKAWDREATQTLSLLYEETIEQLKASSQHSLESAHEQSQQTIQLQQQMSAEAVKQATFGISSTNQTLSDLIKRLIPILAAKDTIAAGQLSTLTDPAGGSRQELVGTPYDAENDAVLASVNQAIDAVTSQLQEAGIEYDTARSTATETVLLSRQ